MKHFLVCFSLFVGTLAAMGASLKGENIDAGWLFRLEQTDAAQNLFSDWTSVCLPHDWSVAFPAQRSALAGNDGGYLPTGLGVYRKTLHVAPPADGEQLWLYIEGAYMNASVWADGDSLGGHPYGYTSFATNITRAIHPDGTAKIEIRVDNRGQKNSRWYTGSGLYRHVWLSRQGAAHIVPQSLVVTTAMDKTGKALVSVTARVEGAAGLRKPYVSLGIEGMKAVRCSVAADGTVSHRFTVANPKLWSPDSPRLYYINMVYGDVTGERDRLRTRFGIRTLDFSPESGLTLNGKHLVVNGACVHHDNGILGAASYDAAEVRKVRLLKDAGFNAVRSSHNAPSDAFLNACDSIGLLVIDEAFDGWRQAKNPYDYALLIDRWGLADLEALVVRDRNHPSIISWSIGNEILERKTPEAVSRAQQMVALCHRLDPTRPVTQALASWDADWQIYDPLAAAHDVVGYNYLIEKVKTDHQRVPQRIIWQTESYPADVFRGWQTAQTEPYFVGDFVWTGIDYLGESGIGRYYYDGQTTGEHYERDQWPWRGSECGLIDLIGTPKPSAAYRNVLYNSGPTTLAVREPDGYRGKVNTTKWGTWPTRYAWEWPAWEGKPIDVEVYSRLPHVALFLNGKKVAEADNSQANGYCTTFHTTYAPGTLVAKASDDQGHTQTSNVLTTPGVVADVKAVQKRYGMGDGLIFFEVTLTDAEGHLVQTSDTPLKVETTGGIELLALGTALMTNAAPYSTPERSTHQGRALIVIRRTEAGTLSITAPKLMLTRKFNL